MIHKYSERLQSLLLLGALGMLFSPSIALAQAESVSESSQLLPETTVIQVQAKEGGAILSSILEHPLRERVEALPVFDALMQSEDLVKANFGLKMFGAAMGKPWDRAVETLTDGGLSISVDTSQGVALLAKSGDVEMLGSLRDFIVSLGGVKDEGAKKKGEYRGIEAFALQDKWRLAVLEDWLLITNKSELGMKIIDNFLDGSEDVLANRETYQAATKQFANEGGTAAVNAFVDIQTIRESGTADDFYRDQTDNPFAELLFGGILNNLNNTPFATAKLSLDEQKLKLQFHTPHDSAWEAPREHFFGAPERAYAPQLLEVKDRLFALSAYRDISQMWLRAGDLMTEKANDDLAKADTQLTTFFSGKDFGEDVLGSFEAAVQFVAKPQEFGDSPVPTIQLPAFAFQFQMRNPDESQHELRRVFQSFVGFINVVGAMNGQPQFDLDSETRENAKLHFATYVPLDDDAELDTTPINYNFSPTVAFAGKRFILASATSLARELVDGSSKAVDTDSNTTATLDAAALHQVLDANRGQLVAQNMLEKGHDEEAAQGEIGLLLDIVQFFEDANMQLDVTDQSLDLKAEVSFDE